MTGHKRNCKSLWLANTMKWKLTQKNQSNVNRHRMQDNNTWKLYSGQVKQFTYIKSENETKLRIAKEHEVLNALQNYKQYRNIINN